jgi:hypothetical protein
MKFSLERCIRIVFYSIKVLIHPKKKEKNGDNKLDSKIL